MALTSKYLGPTRTYTSPLTDQSLELVENELYTFDIQVDGPQIIINGRPMQSPDATYWLIFEGGRIKLPYSAEALPKQWEGLAV